MSRHEELYAAPAEEPITLAEAKLHVRQDGTADDDLITALIVAARRSCETRLRQALVTQTWDLYLDAFPGGWPFADPLAPEAFALPWGGGGWPTARGPYYSRFGPYRPGVIAVPRPPLQSVTSITYVAADGTSTTLASTEYQVSAGSLGRVAPAYAKVWPVTRPQMDAVRVRFVAGYGAAAAVPANVKAAIKIMVGHLYENRDVATSADLAAELPVVGMLLAASDHGSYA
jgi:hypothetical protein